MSQDWDIKPRGEKCTDCEQPFTDKQPYHSLLTFASAEGYHRADLCDKCLAAHQEESGPVSSWQGMFRLPPPPPEEALKKETAETMLRRLMEDEDDTRINVIYILAVMLERKRILVERDIQTKDDGTTIRVYEHRQSGETFLIPEPYLRLDQLEHVQTEVVEMLGGSRPKKKQSDPQEAAEDTETTEASANDD
jgi:hypothetical protein